MSDPNFGDLFGINSHPNALGPYDPATATVPKPEPDYYHPSKMAPPTPLWGTGQTLKYTTPEQVIKAENPPKVPPVDTGGREVPSTQFHQNAPVNFNLPQTGDFQNLIQSIGYGLGGPETTRMQNLNMVRQSQAEANKKWAELKSAQSLAEQNYNQEMQLARSTPMFQSDADINTAFKTLPVQERLKILGSVLGTLGSNGMADLINNAGLVGQQIATPKGPVK